MLTLNQLLLYAVAQTCWGEHSIKSTTRIAVKQSDWTHLTKGRNCFISMEFVHLIGWNAVGDLKEVFVCILFLKAMVQG